MQTQLIFGTVMAAVLGGAACNRVETDQNARRAAEEVRHVAARASEELGDRWLTTKMQAQYFADEDIKARYISVSTVDGVVLLDGTVPNTAAKQRALTLAREAQGVVQVIDRITVGRVR